MPPHLCTQSAQPQFFSEEWGDGALVVPEVPVGPQLWSGAELREALPA